MIKHFDTEFHRQMKHLEVCQKYSAVCRIFNSLLSVSFVDETLHLILDILCENAAFLNKHKSSKLKISIYAY